MKKGRGVLEELHDWYSNLGDKEQKEHCIFAVHGDNKEEANEVIVHGKGEDIVMSLSLSMLEDEGIFKLIEVAYLSTKIAKEELKETKEEKPKKKSPKGTIMS